MNTPAVSLPPTDHELLARTARVALAAYLHDLGKFAERAGAFDGDPRLDAHLTLYCPFRQEGSRRWFTHRHAAHTALAFDLVENHLPDLAIGDVSPFRSRAHAADRPADAAQTTDSLVNAAAAHHRPDTFLQWIVATADRVASGFEREEFERYNAAEEGGQGRPDHIRARQLTLLEQIRLPASPSPKGETAMRYRLAPLNVESIFPARAAECESRDRDVARAEYLAVWQRFVEGLGQIPAGHRSDLPLWLDHFDSLWLACTHAIPAATAFGVKPEVSLYDHSRTTAALAVALWRWHVAHDACGPQAAAAMRERADYGEAKLLLIQGDFFGIQAFVFADGGQTRKHAAKLLRGRSFQVSLFTEIAAVAVLDALSLPPTSQVVNAAGKFLIVAPNTPDTVERLQRLRESFERWFLDATFGQAGVGLAWSPATCNDLVRDRRTGGNAFRTLLDRLHRTLEVAKHRRFDLASTGARIFDQDYPHGPCDYNGRLPADRPASADHPASCALSRDQLAIGNALLRTDRLSIWREDARVASGVRLELPLFGYRITFDEVGDDPRRFDRAAGAGELRRCWDFSLPRHGQPMLFDGLARRFIGGHVPRASADDFRSPRYADLPDDERARPGELATLDMIARADREVAQDGTAGRGIAALGVLKGDVDDLGELFRVGLEQPSFAKWAALSRQVHAFFAVHVPAMLAHDFPSMYTVFAGGDDFLLIGPWHTTQRAAARMRTDFARYAAGNAGVRFSAGIATQKPGAPLQAMVALAENALEQSKAREGKDAVTCFGQTVPWRDWPSLEAAASRLSALGADDVVSRGYLYALLHFVDAAERERRGDARAAEASLWRAHFRYRTARHAADRRHGLDADGRRRLAERLTLDLGVNGIDALGAAFRVPLFNHLYLTRNR